MEIKARRKNLHAVDFSYYKPAYSVFRLRSMHCSVATLKGEYSVFQLRYMPCRVAILKDALAS